MAKAIREIREKGKIVSGKFPKWLPGFREILKNASRILMESWKWLPGIREILKVAPGNPGEKKLS